LRAARWIAVEHLLPVAAVRLHVREVHHAVAVGPRIDVGVRCERDTEHEYHRGQAMHPEIVPWARWARKTYLWALAVRTLAACGDNTRLDMPGLVAITG